jgi:formamidopyrimidine-DNA glycosylase
MEPLGDAFDLDAFHAGLKKRKSAVKQVLLAGDVVVGVGNIYASEALFQAGIRPTLSAARISRPRAAKLHAAVREILARAVEKGGSTLRDFSNVDGRTAISSSRRRSTAAPASRAGSAQRRFACFARDSAPPITAPIAKSKPETPNVERRQHLERNRLKTVVARFPMLYL